MQLKDLNWPAVDSLDRDMPVVIPIAALEQHGHHLPLFTDSMLLGEIVRRVDERMGERVLFAPLTWLGNSEHHMDFAGTLSAPPRTYIDLLAGLLENFLRHGFKRVLLINGHGGNDTPGHQAIFEVRQRYRTRTDMVLLFATYWRLASPAGEFSQSQMGHACEWETSMVLRLAPQLVGDLRALEPLPSVNPFAPAVRAWTTKERTSVGYFGDPRAATADKGEVLLHTFAGGVEALLERMIASDGRV